ncbi:MAG: hypothetical protein ACPGVU_07975 [Limisphaerales bacterium]
MRHLLILLTGVLLVGCGGEAALRKATLSKLGRAYHGFFAREKRTPVSIDEMEAYLLQNNKDTNAVAVLIDPLRSGAILFVWQGQLSRDGETNDKFLLGYEKNTPKEGGYMLTGGGYVDHVSPEEFAQYKPLPSGPLLIPNGQ